VCGNNGVTLGLLFAETDLEFRKDGLTECFNHWQLKTNEHS